MYRSKPPTDRLPLLLGACLAVWLAASCPIWADKPSLGDVINRAEKSVVRIVACDASGKEFSQGSGFVLDPKGLVATNYHVTRGAAKILIQFRDGKQCPARSYRALDRDRDLAILEVDSPPKGLLALELAAKATPRPGDSALAIGHPKGLSFSATNGIVSAVRKTTELPEAIRDAVGAPPDQLWVQTSAPIAHGSSGGPLLDADGKVVGINTWTADSENFGFAIHARHLAGLLAQAPTRPVPIAAASNRRSADVDNPLAEFEPRIREMYGEYQNAAREFRGLVLAAKDEAEQTKLFKSENPSPKYARRFLEIANSEPRTVAAFQALCLACSLDAGNEPAATLPRALDRLLADHGTDKGMIHALSTIALIDHACVCDFLRKLAVRSPHKPVRGIASFCLALHLSESGQKPDPEAVRLLETCQKDFRDVDLGGNRLGELARPLLYKVHYLAVGQKAQDIIGRDLDGKPLKLSDFRGKVVLLDFFADWCPHCSRMYPHERDLAAKYVGKPFVILGVNAESKDTLRQLQADKKVTWPCWWDGDGMRIGQAWQVEGYPNIYLIDHEGTIRRVFSGRPDDKELDKAVQELVLNAPADKPPRK